MIGGESDDDENDEPAWVDSDESEGDRLTRLRDEHEVDYKLCLSSPIAHRMTRHCAH